MLLDNTTINEIKLTPPAVQAVKDLLQKRDLVGYGLRVYISGGGCSGFQYGMALDNNIRELDTVFESDGVKTIVDEVSIQYLSGATIDFVDDLMGSGFKIENPNAVSSCGCGNSFRTGNEGGTPQSSSHGCSGCG